MIKFTRENIRELQDVIFSDDNDTVRVKYYLKRILKYYVLKLQKKNSLYHKICVKIKVSQLNKILKKYNIVYYL